MPLHELLVLGLVGLLSFGLSYLGASVGLVFGQLRLPILVYWLGSPAVGAATSMAISAVAALVGAVRHAKAGRVDLRLMATIGIPSAVAAWLTTRYALHLDPDLVKLCIGLTLVITGVVMLWSVMRPAREAEGEPMTSQAEASPAEASPAEASPAEASPAEASPAEASRVAAVTEGKPHVVAEIAVGLTLGALSGIVGLLLGTLRLPAMLRTGVRAGTAVGTNMAIGAVTGVFAGTAAFYGGTVDLWAFGVITPATMIGSYLGASATGRLSKATLHRLIAWTLVGVGAWMAVEAGW